MCKARGGIRNEHYLRNTSSNNDKYLKGNQKLKVRTRVSVIAEANTVTVAEAVKLNRSLTK